uniref:Wall-associated receptor kinase 2-like n=1 Tax=Nelumbo nucifera TaxID=4432 RepID=A0A822Z121_NELNU|nr:TPA_asm: hypothetical protein HUJ06_008012 [Nelumbo nucifera]
MGSGCFMDEPFEIICNSSFNPPRPFLAAHTSKEVIEVSLEQHYVRIFRTFVTQNCYDSHSGQGSIYSSHSSNYTPFTFSATLNKFIAIGCDILAYISADDSENYTAGCVSLCPTTIPDVNSSSSSCSGLGCCRTSIPKGIYFYNLYIHSINTNERTWSSESCSVAFLAAQDFSDFNKFLSINNKELHNQKYPVVLDWGVGNGTCEESRKNKNSSTYACGDANTYCIDSDSGSGYNCNCSQGFHGNPYLPSGCQDIDECKDPNIKRNCHSAATCINTEGSYYCACPSGYHGDGIKLGKGCLPVPDKRSLPLAVVVPLGIGIAMVLITLFGFGLWGYATVKRRKQIKLKQTYFKKNGGLLLERQISSCEGSGRVESTKIFVEEELERATDNFNENRILGKGGFGTVYKGMLSDGKIVAIKKSKEVDENQVDQFINELMILSQINHRNIVKLLGCCLETEVPLLVYEFISNGTLSNHLHDEHYLPSLSWEMRLRIAVQIAGALAYLHSAASIPIFHRDIKPSNILMDEKYNPKVSDLGYQDQFPLIKLT